MFERKVNLNRMLPGYALATDVRKNLETGLPADFVEGDVKISPSFDHVAAMFKPEEVFKKYLGKKPTNLKVGGVSCSFEGSNETRNIRISIIEINKRTSLSYRFDDNHELRSAQMTSEIIGSDENRKTVYLARDANRKGLYKLIVVSGFTKNIDGWYPIEGGEKVTVSEELSLGGL